MTMLDERPTERAALRAIAELIVGNCPMWFTMPEAYCEYDQVHCTSINQFVDDLHAIVYPFAADMLATPEKWRGP